MKIICHRGNTFGPDPDNENKPEVIDYCIRQGYDVEVDLWYHNKTLYLGHDEPKYPITKDYLYWIKDKLWIHCKNLSVLGIIGRGGYNYFLHQNDDYVLTSSNFVWTYPRPQKEVEFFQVLLDFSPNVDFEMYKKMGIYGLCVDYV